MPSSTYSASSGPSTISSINGPSARGSSSFTPSSTYSASSGPSSSSSSQKPLQLGPTITGPTISAPTGRGSMADGSSRRQRSIDRTNRHQNSMEGLREQTPPTIRVHTSPARGSPGQHCVCVCVCAEYLNWLKCDLFVQVT